MCFRIIYVSYPYKSIVEGTLTLKFLFALLIFRYVYAFRHSIAISMSFLLGLLWFCLPLTISPIMWYKINIASLLGLLSVAIICIILDPHAPYGPAVTFQTCFYTQFQNNSYNIVIVPFCSAQLFAKPNFRE